VDHLRAIDRRRIRSVYGQVTGVEMASIDAGLVTFLGLPLAPPLGLQ
jgi:hypothetical protein